jgi:hypothetical protein
MTTPEQVKDAVNSGTVLATATAEETGMVQIFVAAWNLTP